MPGLGRKLFSLLRIRSENSMLTKTLIFSSLSRFNNKKSKKVAGLVGSGDLFTVLSPD